MAEALLEVLELGERATNEVMRPTAGALQVLGELGERPVLMEMQAACLALVLGEQRAVDVKQPLLRDARGECLGGDSFCQGQDLDILPKKTRRPGPPRRGPRSPAPSIAADYATATADSSRAAPSRTTSGSAICTRRRAGMRAATTAPTSTTA